MKNLQEAKDFDEAVSILDSYRIPKALKETSKVSLRTAFLLKGSPTSNNQQWGNDMIRETVSAIQEANGNATTDVKTDGGEADMEKKLKEEVLDNNNPHTANAGSNQSSDNTEPYPQEGTEEPVGDATEQPGAENQMQENINPLLIPGMDPQVAQQMAQKMPQMPPMSSPQQMQQMQYTVREALNDYHRRFVAPLIKERNGLREAIKSLEGQIRESSISNGSVALDMGKLSAEKGIPVRVVQETSSIPTKFGEGPTTSWDKAELEDRRRDLKSQDRAMRQGSTFYQ